MLVIVLLSLIAASLAVRDCNFDRGLCGWRKNSNGVYWYRSGSLTDNTGPDKDHTSGKGKYLCIDAWEGYKGDSAELYYRGFTGTKCMTFWFHMYGTGIGSLSVFVDNNEEFSKKGPQGNMWKKAQFYITGANSKIRIKAVRGKNEYGDIAVDDISFTDNCGGGPGPSTAHPTPPRPSTPPVPGTIPPVGSCGMKGKARIVGGNAAKENEWPWQAFLMDKRKSQFCGGSLISPNWVLTAAHCVEGESTNTVQVRLGAHKRTGEKPGGVVQDFKVVKIISHEKYNSNTQSSDIALLKLERNAILNSEVNVVCLPESVPDPAHGQMCWTTGWGTLSSGGSQPNVLHEVQVPAVSQQICKQAYGKNSVDDTMICAGLKEGGKDACQGDSGGPFVCGQGSGDNERFFLHGATSWGEGCAGKEKYGVYARVSHFNGWIRERIGNGNTPNTPSPPVNTATPPPPATPAPPVNTSPPGNCGNGPSMRIVGGADAQEGDWPWQALMQSRGGQQFCGGTLVAPQWVVTASHCVEGAKPSGIVVRMGAHKKSKTSPNEQKFNLVKIIMHENYNKGTQMSHDIALLKLEKPAMINRHTGLACLPAKGDEPSPGKTCAITGWGTLKSGGKQPDILQAARVPIKSQDQCIKAYGPKNIHDSMICAGLDAGGKDSCQGDSGGPMVCKDAAGKYHLHGVTSWGYGCADPGKYGVYGRVTYLADWIHDKMNNN